MQALTIVLVVEAAAAVAIVVVTVLAARGVIPRNGFAGIRIAPTMRSDDAWQRGHAAAVVPMVCTAVATVAWVVIAGALHLVDAAPIVGAAILLVGAVLATVVAARAVR